LTVALRRAVRWAKRAAATAALLGAVILTGAFYLPCPAPVEIDGVPAALVLSGDPGYLRAARAAALQREGRVAFIVMTGAGVAGDNGAALARAAIARGADPARILAETRSTTTRENLVYAAPIVRGHGWRRVALITSRVHMFRALHAARAAMPEVEWLPVPVADVDADPPAAYRRHRLLEWSKIVGYGLRGWLR
jgi:uncharacterized SAM-binding protein YcdF (DUF218 family)